MRLLYLISEYPKVSHSFVRREIGALVSLGHDVIRVSIRGWDLPLADPHDVTERAKTHYVLMQGKKALLLAAVYWLFCAPRAFFKAVSTTLTMSRRADKTLFYHVIYLLEACWLAKFALQNRVDHIHAHFGTNPAEVAALASVLSAVPFSFTVHGPEEFDHPAELHLRAKVALSKFVVGVSSFGRSQLLRWVRHEDWNKVKVVHCGLDDKFLDAPLSAVPTVNRLVCVGRLSGQKGQLLLLEAVAMLQSRGVIVELVLAGDGEMRGELEAEIIRLGISGCVRITGWISADQVQKELLASRAMVLPSFAEGLPVVVMEAMALGRPVLSTYVAGIPELLLDGQTGWLFPAGDAERLAEVMQECLMASSNQLNEMGLLARDRVGQRHSAQTEAMKLHAFFSAN